GPVMGLTTGCCACDWARLPSAPVVMGDDWGPIHSKSHGGAVISSPLVLTAGRHLRAVSFFLAFALGLLGPAAIAAAITPASCGSPQANGPDMVVTCSYTGGLQA